MKLIKNIKIEQLALALIISYLPFHLLEEFSGNYNEWMYEFFNMPKKISKTHWLINNGIFSVVLITGYFIYRGNPEKRVFIAVGLFIWGLMNAGEHIAGSFVLKGISPGLFSSVLFISIFIIAIIKLINDNLLNLKTAVLSIVSGIAFWGIPLLIIVAVGKYLIKLFPY